MKAEATHTQIAPEHLSKASVHVHSNGIHDHKIKSVVTNHNTRSLRKSPGVEIGLNAAIVAVNNDEPMVLVVSEPADMAGATDGLPFGPFSPLEHRTLEIGLRSWVSAQTGIDLGYVEQLYTFGDRGREAEPVEIQPHVVSIGYLALTRIDDNTNDEKSEFWRSWYHYFPWEDWRSGRPEILDNVIAPALEAWAQQHHSNESHAQLHDRSRRVRLCFGLDGTTWDEEKVLERYELLFEAGLVPEAKRNNS